MSRRTSEAAKAVREAWENEQQLVREGKGTRDWTAEQQQDILEKGRAYDSDGKAFEGHHMKSAEAYPQYQGDALNIQFLSRPEHQNAHGGNFRNPTNGYYDPVKELTTKNFGNEAYEPCEIINLSKPVIIVKDEGHVEAEMKEIPPLNETTQKSNMDVKGNNSIPHSQTHRKAKVKSLDKKGGALKRFATTVMQFGVKHPIATGAILTVLGYVGDEIRKSLTSGGGKASGSNAVSAFIDNLGDTGDDAPDSEVDDSTASERNYPDERSSPCEHDVSGYDRQQNGKTVHVRPYKRGGRSDE